MTMDQTGAEPGPALTEDQLAGIACAGCGAADCPLYDAGILRRTDGLILRHYPVVKCRACLPDRQMIVIASSEGGTA